MSARNGFALAGAAMLAFVVLYYFFPPAPCEPNTIGHVVSLGGCR